MEALGLGPASHIALMLAAAFVAGALNAVAGGGSFLTLPALVFTGVPPVVANATGTVALLPGYAAGAWGFKDDMAPPPGLSMRQVVVLSLLGGSAGAALLLFTPDATFRKVVPWLLLAATALFAFGPQLRTWAAGKNAAHAAPSTGKAALGMLAVAIYGGYFNGGLGILLLALFGLLGQTQLNAMNGMKNVVSALLTAIAVAIYAVGGIVEWPQALLMMVAATAGGYGGARVARRIPAPVLRWGIVATGLVMAGLFFAKG
ncbi:sulfite exporter TauE/SafE family protein [Comamonas sp. 17RB]|uniref:sulfite exporter TauE/SafE family protein n=1 Tax=Comamonas sp. 17RB TaxID=3047025 RepID=UPI0024B7FDBE|nr:sulfite exporter TauE/SafE family protein [Comamonas sp. 17RB]MDI9856690.1 sulfite exporter TauE/SafE family protein [Comamonas sp. 17RB]